VAHGRSGTLGRAKDGDVLHPHGARSAVAFDDHCLNEPMRIEQPPGNE
jgi:hypothetical protein